MSKVQLYENVNGDSSKTVKVIGDSLKVAPSLPLYKASSFISVNTAAVGGNFVPFPDTPCDVLYIENNTAVDLEIKKGASNVYMRVFAGGSRYCSGISNASEISIRRVDLSNVSVNAAAEAISI